MADTAHTRIGNWLRRAPQPAYVMADGEKLPVTNAGDRWRQLVQSIVALDPEKLVAHASNGNVLRAVALRSDSESKASGADTDSREDDADPLTRPLTKIAAMLADAYDKSSKAPHPLERVLDLSMQMSERQSRHIAALEAENMNLRRQLARLFEDIARERADATIADAEAAAAAAAVAPGGDIFEQAAAALMSGMAQGQSERALQPGANGAGKQKAV